MNPIDLPSHLASIVCIVGMDELPDTSEWLTRVELDEAESIRLDRRRNEWLLGRIAAKRLAMDLDLCRTPMECAVPGRGVRPRLQIHGRPSDLYLSISHSGELAAAAISRNPVGVDIQKRRSIDARAIRFFLRDDEIARFEHSSEDLLLDLWSAKEAALKASGVALYRDVSLHERRDDGEGAVFSFGVGAFRGEVEIRWMSGRQVVLAVARGDS